ncbi:MAG: ATP-binding cassette domain-containing protein [Bacillota bacterium]
MQINSIYKSYGEKKVVNDVSFEIPKNKITSLIGPNGAGKSTVLNLITRLIARDDGHILIDEKDIKEYKSKQLAKKLAILTQTNHITMKLTVRELVAFGRFPHSGSRLSAADYEFVDNAIAYMELEEFADRFIDQLSGGQRQRAYIAMVIAQDTEYVFLDEPTNNLDIYHSSNMMKLCKRLCDELGKTVVLVLHEINFAATYSDYIGAFLEGKLHKFGKVEDVINKQVLKQLYHVDFDILDINGKPVSIYY